MQGYTHRHTQTHAYWHTYTHINVHNVYTYMHTRIRIYICAFMHACTLVGGLAVDAVLAQEGAAADANPVGKAAARGDQRLRGGQVVLGKNPVAP